MAQFMLVLHDDPSAFTGLSPEAMQAVVQKYTEWAGQMAAQGRLVAGEKLTDAPGKVLRRSAGKVTVKDGPYSETKEVFGGYFIIQAANSDEAVRLCHECPHLDYGTIELREIEAHEAPAARD